MKLKWNVMRILLVLGGGMLPMGLTAGAATYSDRTPGTAPIDPSPQVAVSPYVAPADVFVPNSSRASPADAGRYAHTNYVVRNIRGVNAAAVTDLAAPEPQPLYESDA